MPPAVFTAAAFTYASQPSDTDALYSGEKGLRQRRTVDLFFVLYTDGRQLV